MVVLTRTSPCTHAPGVGNDGGAVGSGAVGNDGGKNGKNGGAGSKVGGKNGKNGGAGSKVGGKNGKNGGAVGVGVGVQSCVSESVPVVTIGSGFGEHPVAV